MTEQLSAEHLNDFYKNKKHDFTSYLNAPTFRISDIHKFRVSIKKIKIIFQVFEMLPDSKFEAKENFDIFKSVFKTSGKIREIQLILLSLGRYKIPEHIKLLYKNHLLKNELSLKSTLKRRIEKFDKDKLNKISKKIYDRTTGREESFYIPELFANYLKIHFQKIQELRAGKETSETIHMIRKHFKAMQNALKLMNELKASVHTKKILTQFDKIGMSIGKWHDRYVFINSLEAFMGSKKTSKHCVSFLKFKNEIENENALQLKRVYHKIDNLLNTFEISTKIELQIK
ncbi:MAG: CHAD domain-containing protein [Bacteroidia bacterium]